VLVALLKPTAITFVLPAVWAPVKLTVTLLWLVCGVGSSGCYVAGAALARLRGSNAPTIASTETALKDNNIRTRLDKLIFFLTRISSIISTL
jgi:hypothetical protein